MPAATRTSQCCVSKASLTLRHHQRGTWVVAMWVESYILVSFSRTIITAISLNTWEFSSARLPMECYDVFRKKSEAQFLLRNGHFAGE
jgi:hypothetical protein